MKICEDCIKQDVCKFKKEVEKYEQKSKLPEPLTPDIDCKYKRTEPSNWYYTTPWSSPCTTTTSDIGYTNPGNDCMVIGCYSTGTLYAGGLGGVQKFPCN